MADVQSLFLQIDASVELLRQQMAKGDGILDGFGASADRMATRVDTAIGAMGSNFGRFEQQAQRAARVVERSFTDSFTAAQKTAASITIDPRTGRASAGAAEARAAATAARGQAAALQLVATAAERDAASTGVMTRETMNYVQATRIAAIAAQRQATELARDAGAAERLEIELNQLSREQLQAAAAANAHAAAGNRATRASGQQRAGMQQLGFQLSDISVQYSMGTSAAMIFAMQSGQVIQALGMMTTRTSGFLAFLGGPWGAIIGAATVFLTPFVAKLIEGGDALDKETKKLEDGARKTDLAERAKRAFKKTEQGLIADVRELTEELDRQNEALKTNAERQNIRVKNDLEGEKRVRSALLRELNDAKASANALRAGPNATDASFNALRAEADARVAELETRLASVQASISEAQRALVRTQADLVGEQVKRRLDPVASINYKYDGAQGLIEKAKLRAVEEKRTAGWLDQQLTTLEKQRAAELKIAQARSSSASNRQSGREIDLDQARSIIAGIGGRVTSGLRSRETQARLYADMQAGRHNGPVARPGTSAHESGNAMDVAYGPGISIASIRRAFAEEGVTLRKVLNEPGQRVFHIEWGKKGPSAERIASAQRTIEQREIGEDISFTAEERSARKRLIDAKQKTAATEAEADSLAREEIDADAAALKTKYDLLEKAGKLDGAEATRLRGLVEETRQQQLRNVAIAAATRTLERQFDAQAQGLDAEIATLRLKLDLARTTGDRRALAKQLLEAEQKQARLALERIRDTSQDPREVARAIANLKTMPDQQQLERDRLDGQNRGAFGDYRQSLIDATGDMDAALEGVAVGGLGQLEDGLVGVIDGTKSVGAAFRDMASSILSDLARIAIKKAILSAIGFAGFAEGGEIGSAPGYAGGGSPGGLIQGPGTGTSDSILALLGGGGAIRVSNEEFIVNAASTKRFLPLLHAINSGRLTGFAGGGAIGAPSIPRLSLPAIPRLSAPGGGGGGGRAPMVFDLRGALVTEQLMRQINERISSAGAAAVVGGSQMAQDEARWQSSRELR